VGERQQPKRYTREEHTCITVHMVLEVDGDIVDPSYEVAQHRPLYHDKIHQLPPNLQQLGKDTITTFLRFVDYAKELNNGIGLVVDMDYYNGQADYMNHC
jgi:hypothetical protein